MYIPFPVRRGEAFSKEVKYVTSVEECVRLDRDAWRILVYRNRQYAEVTAGEYVDGLLQAHKRDYDILSCGAGVYGGHDRRVEVTILIAEIGPGPDGSSLTVNYRRSRGSGVEKQCGYLGTKLRRPLWPNTFSVISLKSQC